MKRCLFGKLIALMMLASNILYTDDSQAIPLLSIEPATNEEVTVGNNISLNISINDVTDLFAYQFDIVFDPMVLAAQSITEGAFLSKGGSTFFISGIVDNITGLINFTANSLIGAISGVDGNGILATVNFSAIAAGLSTISLSSTTLLDSTFFEIGSNSVAGIVQVQNRSIPEPASLWLIFLGWFVLRIGLGSKGYI